MSTDLVVVGTNPAALMGQATDVAGVCAEIVKRTAMSIQGRKYVRVEGWQSIAAAYGCVASAVNVERITGGVRAIGELHRIADSALIASAVGFVGEDEPVWFGGEVTQYGKTKKYVKRPDYAIQAMAQTRAISRVCRSAFAFVVVMIDGNLQTTPAEEMAGTFTQEEEAAPPPAPKVAAEQVEAIHVALAKNNVELAELLKKAELTDLKELSAEDAPGAIKWVEQQGKKAMQKAGRA
jgi:hypothetical protein